MKIKKAFLNVVAKSLASYYEEQFTLEGKVHKTEFLDGLSALLPNLKIRFIQTYNLDVFDIDYDDMLDDHDPYLYIQRMDEQELYFDLITNGHFKHYDMFIYPTENNKFRKLMNKFHKYSSKFSTYQDNGLSKTVYVLHEDHVQVYRLSQSVASTSRNVKILGTPENQIDVNYLINLVNTRKVFPVCLMCEGYIESFLDQNTLKYDNTCPECSVILENLPLVRASDRKQFLKEFCVRCTGLYLQESDYLQDRLVDSWNE